MASHNSVSITCLFLSFLALASSGPPCPPGLSGPPPGGGGGAGRVRFVVGPRRAERHPRGQGPGDRGGGEGGDDGGRGGGRRRQQDAQVRADTVRNNEGGGNHNLEVMIVIMQWVF